MAAESVLFGDQPGLTLTEMVAEAGSGPIRGLYILGEDPMLTDPDLNHVRQYLDACEFTLLQEIFPSKTPVLADVLRPGASFAEKEGTFTTPSGAFSACAPQSMRPVKRGRIGRSLPMSRAVC
jgi:predicted molibdopterin-dependent oxidoreductase YjgC